MKFDTDIGAIHFIGIGGIGMSGIAEVLRTLGYCVQGSDLADTAQVGRLKGMGIKVEIGHRAANIGDAEVVVFSSAISPTNPELVEARARKIPVVRRAEMLAELMRFRKCIAVAGTHGKTTTTTMVAALLEGGGLDPTVINGGVIHAYGSNARLGKGDWMVVEADESDGTFLRLPAQFAIVTNLDPEHLEHYGDFETLKGAFRSFIDNLPFYGTAAMCIDHPVVQQLVATVTDRRVITFGCNPQADVRLVDLVPDPPGQRFSLMYSRGRTGKYDMLIDLYLPMPGQHNALNATAACVAALELGVSSENIRDALKSFSGVGRRFTLTGEWNGVTIYDDYAHHPVEIAAVLSAARQTTGGRVIALMQPHRYSRLSTLFDDFCGCFDDADQVMVAPVYAAGESPSDGMSHEKLVEGIRASGHRDVSSLNDEAGIAQRIAAIVEPGDVVLFLGAGNITAWAHALPRQLEALEHSTSSSRLQQN